MEMVKKLFFLCCLVFITTKLFCQHKTINGTFYSVGYSAPSLTFNTDMMFTLKYRGHLSSDTAAGTYTFQNDTLTLKYEYNDYDAIIASYKERKEEVPLDILFSAGKVWRPKILVKKRGKYYVIDDKTGTFQTYKKNGKVNSIYYRKAK